MISTKKPIVALMLLSAILIVFLLRGDDQAQSLTDTLHVQSGMDVVAPKTTRRHLKFDKDTRSDATASSQTIKIVDIAMAEPVAGLSVFISRSDDDTRFVAKTGADGKLHIKEDDLKCGDRIRIDASNLSGPQDISVDIEQLANARIEDDGSKIIKVAIYSGLRILVDSDDSGVISADARVFSIPSPEILLAGDVDRVKKYALIRSDPIAYFEEMSQSGRIDKRHCERRRFDVGALQTIFLPWNGESAISAIAIVRHGEKDRRDLFIPIVKRIALRYGVINDVSLHFKLKPTIEGVLVDASGKPVPLTDVTVATKMPIDLNNPCPRSIDEAGGPGFAMVGSVHGNGLESIAQLTRTTDKDGRFRIPMPYTGKVALWSATKSNEMAYLEVDAIEYDRDIGSITLQMSRVVKILPMRLIDAEGNGLSRVSMSAVQSNPSHPFQRSFWGLNTDESGYLDVSFLDAGREYVFFVEGEECRVFKAKVVPGGVQVARYR